MQEISLAANFLAAQHQEQQRVSVADPKQVAEFERLMNSTQSPGAPMDRYMAPPESPLEVASSNVVRLGTDISHSFRNEMRGIDAKMGAIDVTSPEALFAVTELQMHAYGTMYQVHLATALAGQASKGLQTLLQMQ